MDTGGLIQVKLSYHSRETPKPDPPKVDPQARKSVCRNLFGALHFGETDELIRQENCKTLVRSSQLCVQKLTSSNKNRTENHHNTEKDLITKEIEEYEAQKLKKLLNVNKKDIRADENLSPTSLQESQEKTPKSQICKRKINSSHEAKPHVQQQEITEYFPLRKNSKNARLVEDQTIATGSESTTNSAILITTTATISTISTTTSSTMSSETSSLPTTTSSSSSPHL